MQFGAVLRRMRKEAGLSQEEMAEKLHVSRSNVSRLETDKLELKAIDLLNWCRITNNPDVLMVLYAATDVVTTLAATGLTGFISIVGGIL